MANQMPPKRRVFEALVDIDCCRTPQGRASFFLALAQFSREGRLLNATECTVVGIPDPATKSLTIQCTFRGCGDWDRLYQNVTEEDKKVFFMDMVVTALEAGKDEWFFSPLWRTKSEFTGKEDVAANLAKLDLNEKK